MYKFHLEVKDNSQKESNAILAKDCVSTTHTKRGEWVRLNGIDRIRTANFLAKTPWLEVRVVPLTDAEKSRVKDGLIPDFSEDVLDSTITGAAEFASPSFAPPPPKR